MADICKNCKRTITVACTCSEPNCCRCNGAFCIRCCLNLFPAKIHTGILREGYYVCRRCERLFTQACTCCEEAPYDRCNMCCEAYRHLCCVGRKVIFRSPPPAPFFVGPAILPERGDFRRLSREDSLKVLTKQVRANPLQLTNNRFTRYAAVEIEACQIEDARELNSVVNKWACAVVRDSSTGARGFEINTVPACGNALTEQLAELCTALEHGRAQTDENCGLHVHVDCRDFGYQEIRKFIKIYSVIEPTLFAALHTSRLSNMYCHPCGTKYYRKFIQGAKPEKKIINNHVRNISDTKVLKKTLLPILYGKKALDQNMYGSRTPSFYTSRADHYGRVADEGRNELRYAAVNLHSYFLRGTIEFRMHHAALNFVEICGWTKFLVALLDTINKTKESALQEFIKATPAELAGVNSLYEINESKDVCAGLLVLSSLLPIKYVEHLISKIKLVDYIEKKFYENHLPAKLFFNSLNNLGGAMTVAESGLTEI